jgi:hypothetical protein
MHRQGPTVRREFPALREPGRWAAVFTHLHQALNGLILSDLPQAVLRIRRSHLAHADANPQCRRFPLGAVGARGILTGRRQAQDNRGEHANHSNRVAAARALCHRFIYLLFNGTSSTIAMQNP